MKDFDPGGRYVRLDEPENKVMTFSQRKYIEGVAERYDITDSSLFDIPMEVNLKLERHGNVNVNAPFGNLIEAPQYISLATRVTELKYIFVILTFF